MQFPYDRSFTFKINEDDWEAYLITDEEAKELDEVYGEEGEDIEEFPAMVLTEKKCLFIVEGNVNKGILAHELIHIYVEYLYIGSAKLNVDQFEEVIAEFFEHNSDRYITKRDELFKTFQELEEYGRRK